jgi:hypothetical protein
LHKEKKIKKTKKKIILFYIFIIPLKLLHLKGHKSDILQDFADFCKNLQGVLAILPLTVVGL